VRKLPGTKKEFPLLEKAWEVVKSRKRIDLSDPEERIFPYAATSASAKHTLAKKKLEQLVGKASRQV
jgi:hypothetical protein